MSKVYEGNLLGEGLRFGIVISRFNDFITHKLLDGALDTLHRHGVRDEDVEVARVPGAFEIPLIAKKLAATGRYAGVICLGTVIRGATPHFEYIASEVAKGVAHVGLDTGVPVIFGVITADNLEQALDKVRNDIRDLNLGRYPIGISVHGCGGKGPDGFPQAYDLRYTANANTLKVLP